MLFDLPLLPGLRFRDELIGREEESALIAQVERTGLSPFRFQGWTGKRQTKTFGWRYDFDDRSFEPVEPLPEWLVGLRAQASGFAEIPPDEFVHALVTRYDPGAPIGSSRKRKPGKSGRSNSISRPAILSARPESAAAQAVPWCIAWALCRAGAAAAWFRGGSAGP